MPEIWRLAPPSPNMKSRPPMTIATRASERASGPVKVASRLAAARSQGDCCANASDGAASTISVTTITRARRVNDRRDHTGMGHLRRRGGSTSGTRGPMSSRVLPATCRDAAGSAHASGTRPMMGATITAPRCYPRTLRLTSDRSLVDVDRAWDCGEDVSDTATRLRASRHAALTQRSVTSVPCDATRVRRSLSI